MTPGSPRFASDLEHTPRDLGSPLMSRGCGGLVNCSNMALPDPVLSYMASPDPVLAKASLDPLSAKAFSKPANSKYSDSAITNYLKSGVAIS